MRTIKFRAWVDSYSHWHMTDGITIGNDGVFFHVGQSNISNPDWKLLQYTGLKDIEQFNEPKDLYIGDIVSMHQFLFDGGEYEEEITGVLTYNEDIAAVCLTKIKHHDIRKYMGYGTDIEGFEKEQIPICMFYGLHESSWTYLGNIYENPELLEGESNES